MRSRKKLIATHYDGEWSFNVNSFMKYCKSFHKTLLKHSLYPVSICVALVVCDRISCIAEHSKLYSASTRQLRPFIKWKDFYAREFIIGLKRNIFSMFGVRRLSWADFWQAASCLLPLLSHLLVLQLARILNKNKFYYRHWVDNFVYAFLSGRIIKAKHKHHAALFNLCEMYRS